MYLHVEVKKICEKNKIVAKSLPKGKQVGQKKYKCAFQNCSKPAGLWDITAKWRTTRRQKVTVHCEKTSVFEWNSTRIDAICLSWRNKWKKWWYLLLNGDWSMWTSEFAWDSASGVICLVNWDCNWRWSRGVKEKWLFTQGRRSCTPSPSFVWALPSTMVRWVSPGWDPLVVYAKRGANEATFTCHLRHSHADGLFVCLDGNWFSTRRPKILHLAGQQAEDFFLKAFLPEDLTRKHLP